MGAIHRATRLEDGTQVAIKVMRAPLAGDDELARRFAVEIEAARRVQHPHVVEVLGHGRADGLVYLVMELVTGRSLDAVVLDEAPLDPLRVATLGRQIASGLGAVHAAGVVHRDLKPGNVIIQRDAQGRDHAKLVDFGLAFPTPTGDALDRVTAVDLRVGTPEFMAPEYIIDGSFDARSDLYALGVILYECASGRLPFEGPSYVVLRQQVSEPPPPLREVCAAPAWLARSIDALLNKDPAARPASAEVVMTSLRPGALPAPR